MKKKINTPKDLREDWKSLAEDEIMELNQDIDTLELPEETVLQIEKFITQYKQRLNAVINDFEITAEIALQNNELLSNMLYEVKYNGLKVDDEETVKDMLEMAGYYVIKAPSISEQIRVEAFISELSDNPYQLKLIA
jgi:hypothetical protein